MSSLYSIELAPAQVQELEQVRDHHPKAYIRVKAAGILKVWSGASRRQVASRGLLKPVRRETVQRWIVCYQQEGVNGLLVHTGRGRKPAFSPRAPKRRGGQPRGARGRAAQPAPVWAGAQ